MFSQDLCESFQEIAREVWRIMERNHNGRFWMREDGITAQILDRLDVGHSSELYINDFTGRQEANVSGADWEWWFIKDGIPWGMVVQAKSLQKNQTYSIDSRPVNHHLYQIERLLMYAQGLQDVEPYYCFYNYFDTQDAGYPSGLNCVTFNDIELWGCSMAHALNVYEYFLMNNISSKDLIQISTPWHCFPCCGGRATRDQNGNPDYLRGTNNFIYNLFNGDRTENEFTRRFNQQPLKEIPKRIKYFLDRKGEFEIDDVVEMWSGKLPKKLIIINHKKNEEPGL